LSRPSFLGSQVHRPFEAQGKQEWLCHKSFAVRNLVVEVVTVAGLDY